MDTANRSPKATRGRSIAARAVGWQKPTTRLDWLQWITAGFFFVAVLTYSAGSRLFGLIVAVLAIAALVLVLRRAPMAAASTAVGMIAAAPAAVTLLMFPAWQMEPRQSVLLAWIIAASVAPLAASITRIPNQPLAAAAAEIPIVAGTVLTLVMGPSVAGIAVPVAALTSALMLVSAHLRASTLHGSPVPATVGWRRLGVLDALDSDGYGAHAYTNRRWLVLAWDCPDSKASHAYLDQLVTRAHTTARDLGIPRDRIQPVLLRDDADAVQRYESSRGGVVAVVSVDGLPELLSTLPSDRFLSAKVRAAINCHLVPPDPETAAIHDDR